MKFPLLLSALVLLSAKLPGAIPVSVGDFIYSESALLGRDAASRAYVLRPDGRFIGLYQNYRTGTTFFPASTLEHTGSYSYRRTEPDIAVLVFQDDDGTTSLTRTLRFSSDSSGLASTSSGSISLGGSFRLVSLRPSAPLLNSSNRSFVRAGGTAYSGFVLNSSSIVLVRAVGPGLSAFGVRGALRDPQLSIVSASSGRTIATVDDHDSRSAEVVRHVGAILGAFPLLPGSKDAAFLMPLIPGAYIAQASSVDPNDEGEVLTEIYLLP